MSQASNKPLKVSNQSIQPTNLISPFYKLPNILITTLFAIGIATANTTIAADETVVLELQAKSSNKCLSAKGKKNIKQENCKGKKRQQWQVNVLEGDLKGEQGEKGEQGIKGEKGEQGTQGVAGVDGTNGIDGQDGATGKQGNKGDTGAQGIQGIAGVNGTNGIDGQDGAIGEQGEQGIAGIDGTNGTNGINGQDGATGEQGEKGDTGAQGIQGIAGIQGEKGDVGEQGIQGIQGIDGKDGASGDIKPDSIQMKDGVVLWSDSVPFGHGLNHQVSYINLGSNHKWGWIEVSLTSAYSYQNAPGKYVKTYAIGHLQNTNFFFTNEVLSTSVEGPIASQFKLGNMELHNGSVRIPIYHLVSTGNLAYIHIKAHIPHENFIENLSLSAPTTVVNTETRDYNYISSKLGIGTNNPTAKLEVAGQVKITGGSPAVGKVLTSDASGLATWQGLPEGINGLSAYEIAVSQSSFTGTVAQWLASLKGDTGAIGGQGIQGIAGTNGIDGQNGATGTAGVKGEPGKDGVDGVNGDSFFTQIGSDATLDDNTNLVTTGDSYIKVGNSTASCSDANAGAIRYNISSKVLEFCDGSAWQNTRGNNNLGAVGTIITSAAATCPAGSLKANGQSLRKTEFSGLFSVIGATYGESERNFSVPDLRGEFIRGWDDGRGIDGPRTFASNQAGNAEQYEPVHRHLPHTANLSGIDFGNSYGGKYVGGSKHNTIGSFGQHAYSFSTGDYTRYYLHGLAYVHDGTETRPRNIALLYCVVSE